MTVGELIDKLGKYPNDWNVVISVLFWRQLTIG